MNPTLADAFTAAGFALIVFGLGMMACAAGAELVLRVVRRWDEWVNREE